METNYMHMQVLKNINRWFTFYIGQHISNLVLVFISRVILI